MKYMSTHRDKTGRPSPIYRDKTERFINGEINTLANQQFAEFELDKVKYRVVEVISKESGEAMIYLVENNDKQFILKLYFSGLIPPPNHEIMEIVKQSAETNLFVKIFNHGFWTNPQTQEKHDYELLEYCTGNSLDQVKVHGNEKLLGEIALRCAAALDLLHKNKIIHRDVKPSNFFFRNNDKDIENLMLADFGVSVFADNSGKTTIDYQLRTNPYAAPETYTNNIEGKIEISYKSDFFSLGMMLLILWDGEEIFKISERALIKLKTEGKLLYPDNVGKRTLQLLMAITLKDPEKRAGFEEIMKWAKGETIYDLY